MTLGPQPLLSSEDRAFLLRLARASAEEALGGRPLELTPPASPRLRENGACFVTFKRRGVDAGHNLRGCLGTLEADDPLWQAVRRLAASTVTRDPRFYDNPVTLDELPNLEIDVSYLQPRRLLANPLDFELGADGIVVEGQSRYAGCNGVYLPQVATEHHMDKEEFLSSCCGHKAGMAFDAWRDPKQCKVYAFRAEVFND
jgi:AmmeMemoRadiSam system protein A